MNILLTSVGRRTYLINYFKDALAGEGKVHASNSVLTYSLTQADEYAITPSIYEDGYIDFLLSYCRKNKIKAIVSLFDIDLPVLSKNKNRFLEFGIEVVISDVSVIEICNDKWLTYEFFVRNEIMTPKSFLDLDSVKASLAKGEVEYPLIVKPRWGMGSIGIYKADNEEELRVFYKKVETEIFASYLKYESQKNKQECVIIQQFMSGVEYGIEVINDLKSEYVTTSCKQKIAMRAGETDSAITIQSDSLVSLGVTLSKTLKHVANLDVDCFECDGNFYVLELNARFGGQYPFSHLAGVNLPKQIIHWLNGLDTDLTSLTAKPWVKSCKDICPVLQLV